MVGCCVRPPAADCWRSCCVSRRVPGLQQQHCHTDLSNPSWWSTGCVIDGQFVAVDVLACLMWGALSYECRCVCVFGPWACCMLQRSRLCCCLAGSLKMARLSKVWGWCLGVVDACLYCGTLSFNSRLCLFVGGRPCVGVTELSRGCRSCLVLYVAIASACGVSLGYVHAATHVMLDGGSKCH